VLDTLTPREIQARIRTGATPQELADESGMPLPAVERYAGPPLAERAWTVERAQEAVIRPGERSLSAVMGAEATARGAGPDDIAWDAWRRPDGRWAVVATFDADGSSRRATWIFDPRSKAVVADDAEASRLATEDVVIPMRSSRRHHTEIIPTTSTSRAQKVDVEVVAAKTAAEDGEAVAEVIEISDAGSDDEAADHIQQALDVPAESTRKSKRGRRASVPSWDEILFGSQSED
jgi:hypothetical protein